MTVDVLEWKLYGMFGPTFDPWVIPDLQSGFDGLSRAFRTAAALRDAGLEFVHAPITRPDGAVVARLGDDYAVSVLPFIEGASHSMTDLDRPRRTSEDWVAYTSAGAGAGINPSAVDLYWHIGLLWGLCVSTGTLHSPHVDDADTRHMWTMLQSLLSEAGEACSWGRR